MTKAFNKVFAMVAVSSMLLTACARDMGATVVTSGAVSGKVLEGVIVSATPVTIQESDKLQDNTMGMIGGGVLGAVAGNAVGKGTGNALATVGAGMAGAALGSMAQKHLGKSQGMQYIVRLDPKYVNNTKKDVIRKEYSYKNDNKSVDDEIKSSIEVQETKTDLLSVVQGNDVIMSPGQRVLIVYNNDRPRVTPAQ